MSEPGGVRVPVLLSCVNRSTMSEMRLFSFYLSLYDSIVIPLCDIIFEPVSHMTYFVNLYIFAYVTILCEANASRTTYIYSFQRTKKVEIEYISRILKTHFVFELPF